MVKSVVFYLAFAFIVFATSPEAVANCNKPQGVGVWQAAKTLQGEPKRIEIMYDCRSVSEENTSTKGAELIIRAFHECHPRDCVWGRVPARKNADGHLVAVFETFSARRQITIDPKSDPIFVSYKIDYRSAKKRDTAGKMYMWRVD